MFHFHKLRRVNGNTVTQLRIFIMTGTSRTYELIDVLILRLGRILLFRALPFC